ncbi:MAG: murein L,D-transpeptidase catalytic domain family protein, partial [Candidatus Marinimicrobia bacterium]|nr:murein L,D-transpeptidase catalytic domain family protein [Candidatus Neomarinimicrobiota bacterium]
FITAETYIGSNGYSLRIDGIEKGINHNARKRDIVIHKADYVSEDFIEQEGRLGRSWGCPALPNELSKDIINIIKEGTCIFVYGNDDKYLKKSNYIEKQL